MMGEQQNEARAVFLKALALIVPEERARYLDATCRDKPDLRQRVEALLRARGQSGEFLKQDALGGNLDPPETSVTEGPGTVIGHYKLLEQIGEGGFGVVFMAEQFEPIRRRVALKIVKPGMDTKQVIARFEAERQALALMDHPNIAHVFDAGATETGRPYFVMELVHGVPITQFCDANDLTPKERLKLFQQVCEAVQHAHQKGIIHRDLKPSNILVTLHDGKPVPKVIDFGTAKALQQRLTEKTLFTAYGKLIGTPQYMSPEQAEMSGLDVDTRADIYSLGVLLYELLTGTTPFEAERLRTAAFEEMMRIIRQEEPPKPSTRVSTLGERATQIAKHRQVDAALLGRTLRGDLDWIVMKALEKDRGRRYETANALWEDIQHHLHHEPVRASPPGAAYRTRKFIRRNRMAVAVATIITCVVAIGLTATLVGFTQAKRERNRAVAAEAKAQNEAAVAAAVNQFLQQDLLAQASPEEQPDRNVKLRTLLDRASEQVGSRFRGEPLLEAEIRVTLCDTYSQLGEYTNAQVHLDRALEIYQQRVSPEDPRMLKARSRRASLLRKLDYQRESQTLLEHLLPIHQRVLGPEHHETLRVMCGLAATYAAQGYLVKAQRLAEEVVSVSRRTLGVQHRDTLGNMLGLASCYEDQGKEVEAQKLKEEVSAVSRRALGEEHPVTLRAKHNLAVGYMESKPTETQRLLEELLPAARRVLGPEHPDTMFITVNLAEVCRRENETAQAQALEEEALRVRRQLLRHEHRDTLNTMAHLAVTYQVQRRFAEAQKLFEEVLSVSRRVLGDEHPETLDTMKRLACTYLQQRKPSKARDLSEELVMLRRQVSGYEHPDTLRAMLDLANTQADQGKFVEAQSLVEEVVAIAHRALGEEHPITLKAKHNLAIRYCDRGMPAESQKRLEEVLPAMRRVFGRQQEDTLLAMANLAVAYERQGKLLEARKLLAEEVLPLQRHKLGTENDCTLTTMFNLALCYRHQGRLDEAIQLWREILPIQRRILGPTNNTTIEALNSLATLLGAKGDWPQALEHLQELISVQPDDPWHYYRAHAAALAAGRKELGSELCAKMLTRFGSSQEPFACEFAAKSLLLSSDRHSDAETALALASRAAKKKPDYLWFRTAKAMAEYRLAHYAEAEALLEQPRHDTDTDLACLAGCFYAMSRQQQGSAPAARSLLEAVDRRFAEVLSTGDLADRWHDRCRSLVARAEAERLIHGRETSPPVTAESLAQAREKWNLVRGLLLEGEAAAREAKWKESRDAYLRAVDAPAFLWWPAEDHSDIECLALQMGVAFVRAGDAPTYERHCRLVLGRDGGSLPPRMAEIYAKTCLIRWPALAPELQQGAIKLARFVVANRERGRLGFWMQLTGGMAEYRAGQWERAIELCNKAEASRDLGCKGGAVVYRAMTLKQLGREEEARRVLAQAEALLAEPIRTRSGAAWWDLDICQLALEEARQLIGPSPKP